MKKTGLHTKQQIFANELFAVTFDGVRTKKGVTKLLFHIDNYTPAVINIWATEVMVDEEIFDDGCVFLGGVLPNESEVMGLSFRAWDTDLYYDVQFTIDISDAEDNCIVNCPHISLRVDLSDAELTFFDVEEDAAPATADSDDDNPLAELEQLLRELENAPDTDEEDEDDDMPAFTDTESEEDDDEEIDMTDFWNTLLSGNTVTVEDTDEIEEDDAAPDRFTDLGYDIIDNDTYHIEFDNVCEDSYGISLEFWVRNNSDEIISFVAHNLIIDGEPYEDEYAIIGLLPEGDHALIYLSLPDVPASGAHVVTMTIEINDRECNPIIESPTLEICFDFDTYINTAELKA